jgi:hypothetical protein
VKGGTTGFLLCFVYILSRWVIAKKASLIY